MANVGTAPAGRTLIGKGNTTSPTFAAIGTDSGLTNHGVLLGQGSASFVATAAGLTGQVLTGVTGSDPIWAAPATSGTVTSVNGTVNRITSTGGTDPILDISANYVGQTSLKTLGTITTGVWNGTDIALADGGTNASLTASNGGIFYSTATAGEILAGTATAGQVLRSGSSSAPSWSQAVYPDTTTSQQLLYSSANNTIAELTTANSKFPATDSSGNLSMRALSVVTQVFTSTGTYTPTVGMVYCISEVVGSGGGSGGVATTGAATSGFSGGGGGGEYARGVFSAATIGASQAITIGAGGLAGTAGKNTGGTGGTCSVGALITALGGTGGSGSDALGTGTGESNPGGSGGTGGTGGSFRVQGSPGGNGTFSFGLFGFSGNGGNSYFSGGAKGLVSAGAGNAGQLYGGGGGGSSGFNQAAITGTAGAKGIVVITEYVIA